MRRSHAVLWIWAMFAVVVTAVIVTYSRLPPHELYLVTGHGFVRGGLSRAVVYVNFPVGLAALATLFATAAWMTRAKRLVALLAFVLWLPVFSHNVVSQSHLDARWPNVVPAVGVALALVLSLTTPLYRPERVRGDRIRVGVGALLVLLALPWIAAELGFGFTGVPILGQVFQTGELRHEPGRAGLHPAVHLGDHHGLECTLLVLTALLLSRSLGAVRAHRLHALFGFGVAFLIAYGVGNIANDAWLEQVVKRGWTTTRIPNVLEPRLTYGWLAIGVGTIALWLTLFRPCYPRRTAPEAPRATISSSP